MQSNFFEKPTNLPQHAEFTHIVALGMLPWVTLSEYQASLDFETSAERIEQQNKTAFIGSVNDYLQLFVTVYPESNYVEFLNILSSSKKFSRLTSSHRKQLCHHLPRTNIDLNPIIGNLEPEFSSEEFDELIKVINTTFPSDSDSDVLIREIKDDYD